MHRSQPTFRYILPIVVAFLCFGTLRAQDGVQLQWKFNQGDKLLFEMEQAMEMEMSIAGNDIRNSSTTKTWMSWDCTGLKDGIATIETTIDRMAVDSLTPVGLVKFDSDDKEDSPQAAQIGQNVRGLIGKPMTQTMKPSGEILEVDLGEVKAELGNLGGMPMADMVKQMSKQATLNFPEKPLKVGDKWNFVMKTPSPAGDVQIIRTYTYKGMGEGDAKGLHHFDVVLEMDFQAPPGGATIDIIQQSTKGDLYFDEAAGRIKNSQVVQNVKLRISTGGQQIDQTLNQTIKLNVSKGSAALKKAG